MFSSQVVVMCGAKGSSSLVMMVQYRPSHQAPARASGLSKRYGRKRAFDSGCYVDARSTASLPALWSMRLQKFPKFELGSVGRGWRGYLASRIPKRVDLQNISSKRPQRWLSQSECVILIQIQTSDSQPGILIGIGSRYSVTGSLPDRSGLSTMTDRVCDS